MRRVMVTLLLAWALVALPLPGATASGPELSANRAALFSVRNNRGGTAWIQLNETPLARVEVPAECRFEDCQVRATTHDGLYRWEAEQRVTLTQFSSTYLALEAHFRWELAGLLALAAGALLTVVLYARRVSAIADTALVQEEAEASAGWFPADGSLPRRIGPYAVLSRLGSGGMATVYEVVAPSGEKQALKLPFPHIMQEPEFKKRFQREMALGARLAHPRLVRIEHVEGGAHPYLVMELVQGAPLSDDPPGAAPLRPTLQLVIDVLEVLAYVHKNGIIHRDLKPSNIMRTRDGRIKLMDFGIARDTQATKLTGTDEILGTPLYMAPEQLQGRTVDHRADLYALGVILYERLAGGLPYPDDVSQTIIQKLTQEMPPLSSLRPDIPRSLERYVARLVALSPDARPAGAEEVRDALTALLEEC